MDDIAAGLEAPLPPLDVDEGGPPAEPPPEDAPPHDDGEPPDARDDTQEGRLPANCPVTPLGIEGRVYHFLSANRRFVSLMAKEIAKSDILGLFDTEADWLFSHRRYQRWSKGSEDRPSEVIGFKAEVISRELMHACAERGVWKSQDRIRGAGVWRGPDDDLIAHCGDRLVIRRNGEDSVAPTGVREAHVYPVDEAQPAPISDAAEGRQAAAELLALLHRWQLRRPDTDPYLLLGWIGCALIGGAVRWRPMMWLTGDRATGKSTLQDNVVKPLFGRGLVSTADASAAAIWQAVGFGARPISFDEIEPDQAERQQAVIKLARLATSGARILRGGANHQGTEFEARSCFLFSSIMIPVLTPQDKQRIAILDLDKVPKDAKPPRPDPRRIVEIGRLLKGRMIAGWDVWSDCLDAWCDALSQTGLGGRGQDQFGALPAAADLMLHGRSRFERGLLTVMYAHVGLNASPNYGAGHFFVC